MAAAQAALARVREASWPRSSPSSKKQAPQTTAEARGRPQGLRRPRSPARWPPGRRADHGDVAAGRLDPKTLPATNEAHLAKQPDGSIIVARAPTAKARSRSTAETDLTGITGMRLETIADDRLPGKGPAGPPTATSCSTRSGHRGAQGRPKQAKPVRAPESAGRLHQEALMSTRRSTATSTTRQGLGRAPGHGRHPLGDLRDEGARRRAGRHGAHLHAHAPVRDSHVYLGRFRLSVTGPQRRSASRPRRGFRARSSRSSPEVRTDAQQAPLLGYFRSDRRRAGSSRSTPQRRPRPRCPRSQAPGLRERDRRAPASRCRSTRCSFSSAATSR